MAQYYHASNNNYPYNNDMESLSRSNSEWQTSTGGEEPAYETVQGRRKRTMLPEGLTEEQRRKEKLKRGSEAAKTCKERKLKKIESLTKIVEKLKQDRSELAAKILKQHQDTQQALEQIDKHFNSGCQLYGIQSQEFAMLRQQVVELTNEAAHVQNFLER